MSTNFPTHSAQPNLLQNTLIHCLPISPALRWTHFLTKHSDTLSTNFPRTPLNPFSYKTLWYIVYQFSPALRSPRSLTKHSDTLSTSFTQHSAQPNPLQNTLIHCLPVSPALRSPRSLTKHSNTFPTNFPQHSFQPNLLQNPLIHCLLVFPSTPLNPVSYKILWYIVYQFSPALRWTQSLTKHPDTLSTSFPQHSAHPSLLQNTLIHCLPVFPSTPLNPVSYKTLWYIVYQFSPALRLTQSLTRPSDTLSTSFPQHSAHPVLLQNTLIHCLPIFPSTPLNPISYTFAWTTHSSESSTIIFPIWP